jgi:hypothetical protein
LLASWRCCWCGLSLRQHHGRVARRRLLELLLRRRQLLSGDASSHVNILLYFFELAPTHETVPILAYFVIPWPLGPLSSLGILHSVAAPHVVGR